MELQPGHTLQVHAAGFVRYIDHMGSDQRIVEAARISYRSPSKGEVDDRRLLEYLFRNKHTSPFEMCKITFNIRLPIFVMRQFVRHRMQNLNEVSARYTELPDVFFVPQEFRGQSKKNKQSSESTPDINQAECDAIVNDLYTKAYRAYEALLREGVAREQARIVLPVGIYTEIYTCWDLNNLLKYFSLRDDSHAQAEHQEFAQAMKEITRALFPWTMSVYDKYAK